MSQPTLDMVVPQIALGIMSNDQGDEHMVMEVNTASMTCSFYLCSKDNYRQVADTIAENIRRMGAEMKAPKSKLITSVKELPDGLRKRQKGR